MPDALNLNRDRSERLARRLLREGRIDATLHERARQHAIATGNRFEECLLECGLPERDLLRIMAEMYRVQYISSNKLASAAVPRAVVQLVPRPIAADRQVFPVLLDRKRSVLSIATADPEDFESIKQVEIASQVRTVRPLFARPAAIRAAIAKFYDGDDFAFAVLENANFDPGLSIQRDPLTQLKGHGRSEPPDRTSTPDPAFGGSWAPAHPLSFPSPPSPTLQPGPQRDTLRAERTQPSPPPARPLSAPPRPASQSTAPPFPYGPETLVPMSEEEFARATRGSDLAPLPHGAAAPPPEARPAREVSPVSAVPAPRNAEGIPSGPERIQELIAAQLSESRESRRAPEAATQEEGPVSRTASDAEHPSTPHATGPDPLQLALVLVSLLESDRADLRGHSVQTARLVRQLCERFHVAAERAGAIELAALLHDVGKASGSYHLTAFNVAQFDGHRTAARKSHATPVRMLQSARLPKTTSQSVLHMYERFDGQGFPSGLKGDAIPVGARILAICDSYNDLVSTPRNSYRRVLSASEACNALREQQATIFDPRLLEGLSATVLGGELAQRLQGDGGTVLLVDPDSDETTVLELALLEHHCTVHVACSAESALALLESVAPDAIVSEVQLTSGTGFDLLEFLKARTQDKPVAFVFLSDVTESALVNRALGAGAADFLFKPLPGQAVAAKLVHLMQRSREAYRGGGVTGSLQEMSLPDIVQVLHQGRKSGVLRLTSDRNTGEVYLRDGDIVHATWRDLRGADAFYALLCLKTGTFAVDADVPAPQTTIDLSAEMLLIEGMRRLDEASRSLA